VIIANDETRNKAIKALECINSQDKDKIREGLSIAHEIFHDIANSAAIVNELLTATKIRLAGRFSQPYFEISDTYAFFNMASLNGDIIKTVAEFLKSADKNTPIYDNRTNPVFIDGDGEEEEEEDDDDDE
jgi:hypothetical protein